ncbi:MAG: hypothetical protein JXB17_06950, partial [Bacteroidales bacterium]|nr:hypothetical protein [Bacteroidales bacterium]
MKNLTLFFMFLGMSFYCLAINAPIVTITPDTLNGAGIVQIDITIDNPLNTFLQGEIEIYNPDAEYPPLGMYSYFNDYDLSNGKYVVEFDIPVYATPGNWYVEYIILDYEDSTFTFYSVEINAGFYAINVAPDTIPPKITYFNVSKELAYPGDVVTIEVQIEDEYTGLNHFYIEISHPDYGNVFFEEMFYLDQEKNKALTISYVIGEYEIPGPRSIYVSLSDDGWNYVELNVDSLDFNLTVEGTILDINPPILLSATYIEDNKNYLELVISDNISGVDYFDG